MVGLLGMLAAGGAMGARDASNASVRAQNELEISNAREAMREEFLNRRFDRELDVARENAKAQAAQKEIDYQRSVEAKDKQYAHEINRTGLLNQGKLDQEDRRNAGANARLDKRLAAEKANAELKFSASGKNGKDDNEDLYVTLQDGRKYLPQTQTEKDARSLVIAGIAKNYEDAIRGIQSGKLLGPAISSDMKVFSSPAAADSAKSLTDRLYGGTQNQSGYELNFDPKSKKLIPMGQ